jgi:MoxR-like ATPase
MSTPNETSAARIREAVGDASRGLVDREVLVELIALAAVAREHLLIIGPPGTAKSEAVRRFARVLEGSYFEYLLGRFTEPSEIFGPVDFRRLKEGFVETDTAGMLPEAEIAPGRSSPPETTTASSYSSAMKRGGSVRVSPWKALVVRRHACREARSPSQTTSEERWFSTSCRE